MILDERGEFADAFALPTVGVGSALIGDVIDLGPSSARNIGNGHHIFCVFEVVAPILSGGLATVSFSLVSDAQPAIATDGSASEHGRTTAKPVAQLTAGRSYIITVPPEGAVPYERYLGVMQNVGAFALTGGTINAFLTLDVKSWKAVPDSL